MDKCRNDNFTQSKHQVSLNIGTSSSSHHPFFIYDNPSMSSDAQEMESSSKISSFFTQQSRAGSRLAKPWEETSWSNSFWKILFSQKIVFSTTDSSWLYFWYWMTSSSKLKYFFHVYFLDYSGQILVLKKTNYEFYF